MKNVLQWLFTICVVCTFRCSPSTGPVGPDVLSNLRFAPSAFDSFKRNTELKFSLKVPETLNISIVRRNASGADFRVKILIGNARETRGSHSVSWLGDTDDGLFAPAGIYFALVEIGSQSYETSVQVFHF